MSTRAYGLCVGSPIALPFVTDSDERAADLHLQFAGDWPDAGTEWRKRATIWYQSPHRNAAGKPVMRLSRASDPEGFLLQYGDGSLFRVSESGRHVTVSWPAALAFDEVITYLAGPLMGFVQRLRGTVCLHSSAVLIDGGAVLFVGRGGAGKSTLATALCGRGRPLISEDIAPLWGNGGTWQVPPGCPRLNVWPETADAVLDKAGNLPRSAPSWDKRFLDPGKLKGGFATAPAPLRAVYVLGSRRETDHAIEELPPHKRLTLLAANTYMNYIPDRIWQARDLEVLARVAVAVPVRMLHVKAGLGDVESLYTVVLKDLAKTPATSVKLGI